MSGLLSRKALQAFPAWQKAGWDPSSNTAMLLRALIDPIETEQSNAFVEHENELLFKPWMDKGEVYSIELEEADHYVRSGGSWLGKTITGDGFELQEVTTPGQLLHNYHRGIAPVKLGNTIDNVIYFSEGIWSEEPPDNFESEVHEIDTTLEFPNQVWIQISGGTFTKRRISRQTTETASFTLKGRDINGVAISETLFARTKGVTRSRHIYSYVETIVSNESRGLEWSLVHTPELGHKQEHPFLTAHNREESSKLYLNIRVEDGVSYLEYLVRLSVSAELEELDENEAYEVVHVSKLMVGEGTINTNNWFIHPENGMVYVSANSMLAIFEPRLPEFVAPTHANLITYDNMMQILPERSFAATGETLKFHAHMNNPLNGITKVFVYVIHPDESILFLQADKTWSASEYGFVYNRSNYEDWQDIKFQCEMSLAGQWQFYAQCSTDKRTTLSVTSVYVDEQWALSSMEAEADFVVLLRGHKLLLVVPSDTQECKLYKHTYLADKENNRLYFGDEYEEIEVS